MTAPTPSADVSSLIERLREEARQEEAAGKLLADAKTARQTDREDAWTDEGYDYLRAEQTSRWQAADEIERLRAAIAAYNTEAAIVLKRYRELLLKTKVVALSEPFWATDPELAELLDEINAALKAGA